MKIGDIKLSADWWREHATALKTSLADMDAAAQRTIKAMQRFTAYVSEDARRYRFVYDLNSPIYKSLDSKGRYGAVLERTIVGYETMNYQDLFGYKIIVNHDTPKRQLDPGLTLTPTFRAEYNAWLASFFGYTNKLEDGQCYIAGRDCIMNPRTYVYFKRETVRIERETLRAPWEPGDRDFWPGY